MISPSHNIIKFDGNFPFLSIFLYCQKNRDSTSANKNLPEQFCNETITKEIINETNMTNIKVTFKTIYHFSVYCPQYPRSVLDSELYDTTLLMPYYNGIMNFDDVWSASGICPDSGFYCIKESTYFQQYHISNTDNRIKHWLLAGHDEELHILAESYVWTEA